MTHPAKMHRDLSSIASASGEAAAELSEELEDFEGENESDLEEK